MKIKGILVTPGNSPEVVEFENSLESLQGFVNGYIEMITIENGIDMVINDEGKLMGLELNGYLTHKGKIYDSIVGNILIVGHDRYGKTIGLNDEQIKKMLVKFSRFLIEV